MKYGLVLMLAGVLVIAADGWAQQKTVPPDSDTQLRALRHQIAAMRKQLNTARSEPALARSELSLASTSPQGVQMQLSTLQRQMESLKADLGALKANSVLDLNGYLTFDVSHGYPTALFRGANVQIVNGMGETQTVNGRGNLIVGYNRASASQFACSLGITDSAAACSANGGVWAQSHKSGSHNIIGGDFNNYPSWGGIVLGVENAISAPYTAVLGGARNRAEGPFATIGGGSSNTASGIYSSVSAGFENHGTGEFAAVSGGAQRTAPGSTDWAAGALFQDR
jgi:hypothetical protein